MFIFLSKLLPLFIYPLGMTCLLILIALVAGRRSKLRTACMLMALLVLWLSSTTGFSTLLARPLEWKYLPPEEIPGGEVIVVLGGGTESPEMPRPITELNGAGDRVVYAARLYQQQAAPTILASGGSISFMPGSTSTPAEEIRDLLKIMGIPPEAIWLEKESKNTYENAVMCAEFLKDKDIEQVLLITSALHMPRSVAVFEAQDLEVIPLPVDYSITQSTPGNDAESAFQAKVLDIMPRLSNLSLTTNAMKEYIGFAVYKLQGWI